MIKGVGVAERYHLSKAVIGKVFLCYTVPGNQGTHDKTNQIRKSLQEAYLNTFFGNGLHSCYAPCEPFRSCYSFPKLKFNFTDFAEH